jgi:sugar O-acyltransferase (sialic acid O-acetyltransferase NeuD family)
MINPVIIFGAKGLGGVALDNFKSNGVEIYCFLDDDAAIHGTELDDVSVLGACDDDGYLKLIGKKCDAFVAIDDRKLHKHYVELLKERRSVQLVNSVHKLSILSDKMVLGHGNLINIGVVIAAFAELGNYNMVQTGAKIDQFVQISDYVHIGAGAMIGSNVKIEEGAFVGTGAVIVSGITVGKNARIGAGAVVVENVKAGATVFGNPAKEIKG